MAADGAGMAGGEPSPPPPQGQVRQFFPETWIWDTKRAV